MPKRVTRDDVGAMVAAWRTAHQWTQEELGQALNLAGTTVSKIERGERPLPAHACLRLQSLTHGEITVEQMRPDVFGGGR